MAKNALKKPRVVTAQTRPVGAIKVGKRHRKEFGDLAALAASIDARGGLLQPILIDENDTLIAGERRLRAWSLTKFNGEPIPVHVFNPDDPVAGEWDENAIRKDFTPSEMVAIKRVLAPREAAAAAARILAGKKADGKVKGKTGDKVARLAGVSRATLDRAEAIVEAAELDPETFGSLKETMDRTGKVNGPFKRLGVLQRAAAISSEPPPLPMQGPYRTLVADVPWPSELDDENPAERGRAYYPYATMSIKAIAGMGDQVKAICHPIGAWLWFWIPNFHLVRGAHLSILEAWGFTPCALRTWKKPTFGNGQLLRGQTEQVILCRRGKPGPVNLTNQTTFFEGEVSGEHSEKPAIFFADVETLTPAPRFAYLFAGRTLPDKWDGHGDRVGKITPAEAGAAEAFFLAECDRLKIAGAATTSPLGAAAIAPAKAKRKGKNKRQIDLEDYLAPVVAPARALDLVDPKALPSKATVDAIVKRAEKRRARA